ncbi:MAG: hypothetical protein LBB89_12370 [Treponema sp.]|jgi:hypothetical protein|nr:hypothetical protein [Treponema sp.]
MGGGTLHGAFEGTQGSRSGAAIQKGLQDKHIEGTRNYKQEIKKGGHPGVLTGDAETLLRDGAGKGHKEGKNKETVDYGKVIGKFYDTKTEKYYETTRATIHYDSKNRAHIVPARPIEMLRKQKEKR